MVGAEGVFVYSHESTYWLCLNRPSVGIMKSREEVYTLMRSGKYHQILIDSLEYSPGFEPSVEGSPTSPPPWLTINKRLLSRRWLAEGGVSAVYEVILPPVEAPPAAGAPVKTEAGVPTLGQKP